MVSLQNKLTKLDDLEFPDYSDYELASYTNKKGLWFILLEVGAVLEHVHSVILQVCGPATNIDPDTVLLQK